MAVHELDPSALTGLNNAGLAIPGHKRVALSQMGLDTLYGPRQQALEADGGKAQKFAVQLHRRSPLFSRIFAYGPHTAPNCELR
jgi:hypothetical protein